MDICDELDTSLNAAGSCDLMYLRMNFPLQDCTSFTCRIEIVT